MHGNIDANKHTLEILEKKDMIEIYIHHTRARVHTHTHTHTHKLITF